MKATILEKRNNTFVQKKIAGKFIQKKATLLYTWGHTLARHLTSVLNAPKGFHPLETEMIIRKDTLKKSKSLSQPLTINLEIINAPNALPSTTESTSSLITSRASTHKNLRSHKKVAHTLLRKNQPKMNFPKIKQWLIRANQVTITQLCWAMNRKPKTSWL